MFFYYILFQNKVNETKPDLLKEKGEKIRIKIKILRDATLKPEIFN